MAGRCGGGVGRMSVVAVRCKVPGVRAVQVWQGRWGPAEGQSPNARWCVALVCVAHAVNARRVTWELCVCVVGVGGARVWLCETCVACGKRGANGVWGAVGA